MAKIYTPMLYMTNTTIDIFKKTVTSKALFYLKQFNSLKWNENQFYEKSDMVIDLKELKLFDKKFAEYIRITPHFKIHTSMPDEACFIYMRQGKLNVKTEVGSCAGTPKDTLLLKCGNYIGEMDKNAKENEAIVIHFYPEILQRVFNDGIKPLQINTNQQNDSGVQIKNNELLDKYMDSLLFYFENPALADDDLLILKIKELILILNKIRGNTILQHLYHFLFDPAEFSFKDIIRKHLYSDVSLEDLAHLSNRSLSSFKRDFQKYFTESPSRYIKDKRLEKAAHLLKNSRFNHLEILVECGFNNASHFTKIFKEKYNLTPSQYRLNQSTH